MSWTNLRRSALTIGVFFTLSTWVAAQQPAGAPQGPGPQGAPGMRPAGGPPQGGPGRGGRGPGGGRGAAAPDDNAGFTPIFDGKTLTNWDGDPTFWRVENGEIIAQSTPEKVVKANTFLIWKGGAVKDFEIKAEFKVSETANSGIQYRSALMPDRGQWAMRGPQADIDGRDTFTGMYYEENMRGIVAQRGQVMRKAEGGASKLIASLGTGDELKAFIKTNDWNNLHIIAKGSTMIHIINGHVMSMFIDDQAEYPQRLTEGLIGLQMHVGQPMIIQFRNVLLKKLP